MIINIKNTNIKIWNKLTFLHLTSSHCHYGNIQVFMSTTWLWEYPLSLSCLVILILTYSTSLWEYPLSLSCLVILILTCSTSLWEYPLSLSCLVILILTCWALPRYDNIQTDFWIWSCSGWLPDYENVKADYLIMKMLRLTTWLWKC